MLAMVRQEFGQPMNAGPWKLHTGYLVEGLELFIRKVAYPKYEATVLVLVQVHVYIQQFITYHNTKGGNFRTVANIKSTC
jgi:hypothetical protein